MKVTQNGLQEFPEESGLIMDDIINLMNLINKKDGHLGDIVSCIRTTCSSLKLKADKLSKIFEEQKYETNKNN